MSFADSVDVRIAASGAEATLAQLVAVRAEMQAMAGQSVVIKADTTALGAVRTEAAAAGTALRALSAEHVVVKADTSALQTVKTDAEAAQSATKALAAEQIGFKVDTSQITGARAAIQGLQGDAVNAGMALSKLAAPAALATGVAGLSLVAASYQTLLTTTANNTTMVTDDIKAMDETIRALPSGAAPLADLAGGFRQIMDLGNSAAQATVIATESSKAATETGANQEETMAGLAITMHEYNATISQTAAYQNTLAEASKLGNTTMQQWVENTGRATAVAANLGIPLTDVDAALLSLTRHGFDAATSSTQIAALFQHIINPSQAAQKELAVLSKTTGIDLVSDFSLAGLQTKGLATVLDDLSRATRGNEDAIYKLIPATRGGQAALVLAGQGAMDFRSSLVALGETMDGSLTPVEDGFARIQQTAGYQFGQFVKQVKLDAIDMGQAFLPAATGITSALDAIPGPALKAGADLAVVFGAMKAGAAIGDLVAAGTTKMNTSLLASASASQVAAESEARMAATAKADADAQAADTAAIEARTAAIRALGVTSLSVDADILASATAAEARIAERTAATQAEATAATEAEAAFATRGAALGGGVAALGAGLASMVAPVAVTLIAASIIAQPLDDALGQYLIDHNKNLKTATMKVNLALDPQNGADAATRQADRAAAKKYAEEQIAMIQDAAKQAAANANPTGHSPSDLLTRLLNIGEDTSGTPDDQGQKLIARLKAEIKRIDDDAARDTPQTAAAIQQVAEAALSATANQLSAAVARGTTTVEEARQQFARAAIQDLPVGADPAAFTKDVQTRTDQFVQGLSVVQESAKAAADQIGVVNKAFDGTVKALDSIKQNKGVDGLLASLKAVRTAQTELSQIGMDNKGLDDLLAMGDAFQSLADKEKTASSAFDGYMAASAHTDTYIKKIDETKAHYAGLEQYIKEKPLAARTDADIQFLDKYTQRLATLNNEEAKLKENQVVDANNASSVIPDFTVADANYRDLLKNYGGEVGLKVRLDVDVQQATEAASKAGYLLDQITNHPHTVELAVSGNKDAEAALKRIEQGESAAAAKADIVVVAKATGTSDIQTLADLIAGITGKTVDIVANVTTAYSSTGALPAPGTVPGLDIGRPYATGGDVTGNMAIVGDTRGGDMSAAEVVDFARHRVYSHEDSVRRGWLGGGMPRYAQGSDDDGAGGQPPGTVDANDPNNSVNAGGVYTAKNPGPTTDLSKVTSGAKSATAAVKTLNAAGQEVVHTLVDMTNQTNVLAGYLKGMAEGSVTQVTKQFDQQYALLSRITQAALPKNATTEQKDSANNAAATQAMDVTIAMARALSDATVPGNDLAADFQKIRDTGTPIADNLIRQVSITRELNIANAAILADQQKMTALDDAHAAAVEARTADDRAASRARTVDGWTKQSADMAIQEAHRVAQYQWTQESERLDARKTAEERTYQDAVTAEDRHHVLATRNLDDQLRAAEKLQQTANAGNSALEQALASQAAGPGDLASKFKAGELLSIQKDFDSRNRQTLSDQIAAIKDAGVAETRLYEDDKYHRDLAHTQATRSFQDEATQAANNHAKVQEEWAAEAAQRQKIAFDQQVADSRHLWQLEDTRLAEDARYKAAKDALTDQTKRDQEHAKALTTELTNAQTVESLWEKVYPLAGETANALLTAFSQVTGQSVAAASPLTGVNVIRNLGGIPAHAAGTAYSDAGLASINERGGELRILQSGEAIIPADQTARLMQGQGQGPITVNAPITVTGTSDAAIRQAVAQFERTLRQAIDGLQPAGNYGLARGA